MEDIILNDINVNDDDSLVINYDDGLKKYTLKKKISIFSPVLTPFLGNSYEIKTERVVYE